jgi:hypothetical protein
MTKPTAAAALLLVVSVATAYINSEAPQLVPACNPEGTQGGAYFYSFGANPEIDQWDPEVRSNPPLASGSAMTVARTYMSSKPVPGGHVAWSLTRLSLVRASFKTSHDKNWYYLVQFDTAPNGEEGIGWACNVVVRFDGTVPPVDKHTAP